MQRYSIFLPMLGEGSFGQVYKAKRKGTTEIVALKLIKKHGRTEKELLSLRRECEIQRHFNHPNIIQMLDSFETNSEIVVVTECAHLDLFRILAVEGYLSEDRARRITSDLVSALYYLHSNRVLHRDLKPQNVLLSETGVVKLCDFGFARNMSLGTHVLTSIKGTPLYMAPELMEENPYDHNADLWSLGCIAYEMIVGAPPFKTNNILHLVKLIRHEPIRWPEFASPDCLGLLRGLLEKNPAHRLSWPHLLDHPFVKGSVLITSDQGVTLPLTAELTSSQAEAKELQKQDLKAANAGGEYTGERRRLSNRGEERRESSQGIELQAIRPELKPDFDDEDLIRRLKMMETTERAAAVDPHDGPTICANQKELKEILKLDEGCQEVCLSALESEEWLVFLEKSMEEVMEGDAGSITDKAFISMVCRALGSSSPAVVEYIASLFCVPFAVDSFDEPLLEKIRKAYAEVQLVPRLIYATQMITRRVDADSSLSGEELQAIEVILLLISNLVHTEEVFLEQFCKCSILLRLSPHYALVMSLRRRKVRIATNLLSILSHIVRKMPEYKCVVLDILALFQNPEAEFRSMLNHSNECLVMRALVFLRELSSRCPEYVTSIWTDSLQRDIEALRYSPDEELRSVAESTLIHLLEIGVIAENNFKPLESSAE